MVIDAISEEFENKTIYTLISTPISASQVFAAKVSAAVAAAIVQVIICTALLSWNGIVINRLSLVLILTLSYIVSISFGGAIIATFFKDRQRSQFIYSLIIIVAGSVSCFLKPSPLELLTKLSAGAPNVSLIGFVIYIALAIAVGLIFFCLSERLMTAKG
jgi:ABC-2 type transport system permease protein